MILYDGILMYTTMQMNKQHKITAIWMYFMINISGSADRKDGKFQKKELKHLPTVQITRKHILS